MKSKLVPFVSVVILAAVLVGGWFFLKPLFSDSPQPPSESSKEFSAFNVMRDDLDQTTLDKLRTDFDGAVQILAQTPDDFDALMRIGIIKKSIGDYRGAEMAWGRVSQTAPQNSLSFNNLGDLYANFLNEYDKAEENYKTAIANSLGEEKNSIYARSLYELYYYKVKDYAQAEQLLLEAIQNNPETIDLLVLLARLYREQSNIDQAKVYYQQALALRPANEPLKKEYEALGK